MDVMTILQEEEWHARHRLAVYRARLARQSGPRPTAPDRRLRKLEHKWEVAAERLRGAEREHEL